MSRSIAGRYKSWLSPFYSAIQLHTQRRVIVDCYQTVSRMRTLTLFILAVAIATQALAFPAAAGSDISESSQRPPHQVYYRSLNLGQAGEAPDIWVNEFILRVLGDCLLDDNISVVRRDYERTFQYPINSYNKTMVKFSAGRDALVNDIYGLLDWALVHVTQQDIRNANLSQHHLPWMRVSDYTLNAWSSIPLRNNRGIPNDPNFVLMIRVVPQSGSVTPRPRTRLTGTVRLSLPRVLSCFRFQGRAGGLQRVQAGVQQDAISRVRRPSAQAGTQAAAQATPAEYYDQTLTDSQFSDIL